MPAVTEAYHFGDTARLSARLPESQTSARRSHASPMGNRLQVSVATLAKNDGETPIGEPDATSYGHFLIPRGWAETGTATGNETFTAPLPVLSVGSGNASSSALPASRQSVNTTDTPFALLNNTATTVSDYTAILSGSSWIGTTTVGVPQIVTYSFSTSAQAYLTSTYSSDFISSFQAFTTAEQSLARQALSLWANTSGLVFIEAPAGEGDIQFGNFNFDTDPDQKGYGGFAYYPGVSITNTWSYQSALGGDVFVNTAYPSDLTSLQLLLHEIGHAIGFKHPFDGSPVLPKEQDNWSYTVMSYTPSGTGTVLGTYDVQAVQYLYSLQSTDGSEVAGYSWDSATATLTQTGTAGDDVIRGVYSKNVINGGDGSDSIIGGFEDDVLSGGKGNDGLFGDAGNDTLSGGEGDDTINGGDGNDTIRGGDGNDTIQGNAGRNSIFGDAGDDTIWGGADSETLDGGAGKDRIDGGGGNDTIHGGDDDDTLSGSGGTDSIYGDAGNDSIWGYGGNDTIYGGAGNDSMLSGNAGDDAIYGEDGDDNIYGGVGNDTLNGGAGNDYLNGNGGVNTAVFSGARANYTITFYSYGGGRTVSGPDGTDTVNHVQKLVFADQTVLLGLPATKDEDGDGNSDIFWQSDSGQSAIWTMSGFFQQASYLLGDPGSSWHIKASGDFNGDGYADILWQNDNGQADIWTTQGYTQLGGSYVGGNPGTNWHIRGAGDFNGDGYADILWQNDSGQAAIWTLNGFTQLGGAEVGINPGADWHVKGSGDFNGDGKADILWQNDNGQAAIWLMDGFNVASGSTIGGNPGTSWHVVGAGDFDGDGKSDILWQNDSGQAAIWTMNGLTQTGGSPVGGNPGPTWHAIDAGDFNGDGYADILWQNDNAQAAIWTMQGLNQLGGSTVGGNPGTSWHIAAG